MIVKRWLWIPCCALAVAACGGGSSTKAASPLSTASASGSTTTAASDTSTTTTAPGSSATPEVNPAGDIPDNQVFVAFTDAAGPFTIKVPEGWGRTEVAGVQTFTDKLNSVRLEVVATPSAPTTSSATSSELPAIKSSSKGFSGGKVSTVSRAGGQAVLITYQADSAPDPVTGKVIHLDVERYEFWKGGKEAIVTLSGPVGADNVDPWKIVTGSFAWQ
jgi:hypothetical protein